MNPAHYRIGCLEDDGSFTVNRSCDHDEEIAFLEECSFQQDRVNRGWYVDATVQLRDYDGNVLAVKYITQTKRAA